MHITRIAAHGQPIGHHRLAPLLERVPHHKRVAGIIERYHRLDPGIAKILQLLIIGTIHIGLVSAKASRPPTDLQHPLQLLMPGRREGGLIAERISREMAIEVINRQRLLLRIDPQLHVTPRTPPQRGEATAVAPVGQDPVGITDKGLSLNRVAISFRGQAIGLGS